MNIAVFKPKQAVLVATDTPERITTVIPTAHVLNFKGKTTVAIPHKPEETEVLRNLGFNVPAPMNLYYQYPGHFKPFDAQKTTAEFLSMNRRGFCLNSMGLGKTITSLWATDYLRSCGLVHRTLIVCPISVMERTWADEVFKSFTRLKVNVVYGTRAKRMKLLEEPADFYIINTDAVGIIKDALADRPDIDHIIIDEVALFRNHSSARWRALDEVCNKQCGGTRRVWGMTGSPIPNCPTDAYGQIKLVTPSNPDCPKYFGRFRDLTMLQLNMYKWIPKSNAIETVFRVMQPAIRFALQDVVDLPPQIVVQRKAELSSEQKKAYKEMFSKLQTEVANGTCTAANEAIKASKLLQICSGCAYGEGGVSLSLDAANRLATVEEVVDESEGKTIVFVSYVSALAQVKEHLEKTGHTVEVVDGNTSKTERDRIFYDFQNTKEPQVIVANPTTMSHGLTLTAATTICWFTPIWSNEVYQQANARIFRTGQKRSTVIVQIVSTKLEESVFSRLADKQDAQGALLDMVRDGLSGV